MPLEAMMDEQLQTAVEALRECGLDHPERYATLTTPERVLETCRWYRGQRGRVGPGVLVAELRAGGRAPKRSPMDEQAAYGREIVAWLREHFPQWNRDEGNGTHAAAIACVIRLHHAHGKHGLSASEHGPEIRAAVERFDGELSGCSASGSEGKGRGSEGAGDRPGDGGDDLGCASMESGGEGL